MASSDTARWGAWLLAAGLILLAAWAALEFSSVEEPASPGKTPNPSQVRWDQPIPGWKYSLARGFVVFVGFVLPSAGSLACAAGLGLILLDARSRPGRLDHGMLASLMGVLLLLAGLALMGTTAWQWHVRTKPMEPADLTKPAEYDPESPFFQDFKDWTPQKSDAYWEKMRRKDRLDRLWWRIVLYVFPPVGLIFAALGIGLLTVSPRRP
ncbi:MAG: hypothetical protein HY293_12155 [Planctomycetes bacterium]|nr:hypothetical protein [Planctomycetota bacterium]